MPTTTDELEAIVRKWIPLRIPCRPCQELGEPIAIDATITVWRSKDAPDTVLVMMSDKQGHRSFSVHSTSFDAAMPAQVRAALEIMDDGMIQQQGQAISLGG